MPQTINGKTLTKGQHKKWKEIRAAAEREGAKVPEAVATEYVKKMMREGKKK